VQAPAKYETLIDLKTAKVLGLNVPPAGLVRADETIDSWCHLCTAPTGFGTEPTCRNVSYLVAIGGQADVARTSWNRRE
jgi:hypothetical protein